MDYEGNWTSGEVEMCNPADIVADKSSSGHSSLSFSTSDSAPSSSHSPQLNVSDRVGTSVTTSAPPPLRQCQSEEEWRKEGEDREGGEHQDVQHEQEQTSMERESDMAGAGSSSAAAASIARPLFGPVQQPKQHAIISSRRASCKQ